MRFFTVKGRDPVEVIVTLLGALLVVVFSFFTARGDLDRYTRLLLSKEVPPLIQVVEEEEFVPVSPFEEWTREFPQVSPLLVEATPLPLPSPGKETKVKEEVKVVEKPKVTPSVSPLFPREGAFLQAGAFSQEKNAQAMVETLRRFGYEAVAENVSGMYRVRVYGFASLDEARKAAAKLRSQGIECFVGK